MTAAKLIGMSELRQLGIPYSKSQIYRKIKAKTFPRPVKLGAKKIAFLLSEVDAWIEDKVVSRDGAAA